MNDRFRAIEPHRGFAVLMAASPPPQIRDRRPGAASPSLRQEAIVSLARAVFAVGGQLVMMGDPDVAPIVAAVALDYAAAPSAERSARPVTPLVVVESDGDDPSLRALMGPYVLRDAVEYVGSDGELVAPEGRLSETNLRQARRHPLSPWVIERFELRGAVFIGADAEASGDIEELRSRGVRVAVLTATVLDGDRAEAWADLDPARDFVEARLDRWSERDDRPRGSSEDVVPYPFVMQRLVAEWAGRPRRRRGLA